MYMNEMYHRIETPIGVILVEYKEYRVHGEVNNQSSCHVYIVPKHDHTVYTPIPDEHGRLKSLSLVNWGPDLIASAQLLLTQKIKNGDHRLSSAETEEEETT